MELSRDSFIEMAADKASWYDLKDNIIPQRHMNDSNVIESVMKQVSDSIGLKDVNHLHNKVNSYIANIAEHFTAKYDSGKSATTTNLVQEAVTDILSSMTGTANPKNFESILAAEKWNSVFNKEYRKHCAGLIYDAAKDVTGIVQGELEKREQVSELIQTPLGRTPEPETLFKMIEPIINADMKRYSFEPDATQPQAVLLRNPVYLNGLVLNSAADKDKLNPEMISILADKIAPKLQGFVMGKEDTFIRGCIEDKLMTHFGYQANAQTLQPPEKFKELAAQASTVAEKAMNQMHVQNMKNRRMTI